MRRLDLHVEPEAIDTDHFDVLRRELEAAGVETDPRGFVVVDDQLRTNVPGIWAIGDVNGRGAFTHTSYNDYEILAANLPQVPAHEGFPVLVVHGTEDQQIEIGRARESRQALERFGVDLAYHEFDMGHEIRPEALRTIQRWLQEKVL